MVEIGSSLKGSRVDILLFAGILTTINAGFFYLFYKRHKKMAEKYDKFNIGMAKEIDAIKASIHSLQVSLKAIESGSISDTDYIDAPSEFVNNIRTIEPSIEPPIMDEQNGTNRKMNLLEHVDELYKNCKYHEIYDTLEKVEAKNSDTEVLWRLARACYQMASLLEMKNPRRKELLEQGLKYAQTAYEMDPKVYNHVKWVAALTGSRVDYLGTKEKIEQGKLFKDLLDIALKMNPDDDSLLYMRGRFSFSVASLTWIERKTAAVLFAKPPEATFADAIADFKAVAEIKPEWLENLVYLAKSYLANKEKEKAVAALKRAVEIDEDTEDGEESDIMREAKELLKKHAK